MANHIDIIEVFTKDVYNRIINIGQEYLHPYLDTWKIRQQGLVILRLDII